jgi:hypothetical protein
MTGPEHYREAEEDMAAMNGKSPDGVQALLARAQVHATLALAAATALGTSEGQPPDDRNAWLKAASSWVNSP